ncbi:MOSC domain-containing protein [Sulfitobacter aestuarii]|uniref:MOSC domain-containing protein n=1 Tax=Sulfitobacter aestuarii TaxID=2161676 RepID=A0ABW5TXN7_9RHOB
MQVAQIFRHPLKAHGEEELRDVTLHEGQSMPFDRIWAVAHEAAKVSPGAWAPCANFSRAAKVPTLMAIRAAFDQDSDMLTLSHPERPELCFDPDSEEARYLEWIAPLMPSDRAQPMGIVRLDKRGFTDSPYPCVSLCNSASLREVEAQLGQPLARARWRSNFWIDGLAPWQEFDLLGREISIGDTLLRIRDRIRRCLATAANPETGKRDADTLGTLNSTWNHQDFGIYAEVIRSGTVARGDKIKVH